jgi:hypothetical protein
MARVRPVVMTRCPTAPKTNAAHKGNVPIGHAEKLWDARHRPVVRNGPALSQSPAPLHPLDGSFKRRGASKMSLENWRAIGQALRSGCGSSKPSAPVARSRSACASGCSKMAFDTIEGSPLHSTRIEICIST